MIISLPVQTAVSKNRAEGALAVLVAVQVSGVHPVAESDIAGKRVLNVRRCHDLRRWFSALAFEDPPGP